MLVPQKPNSEKSKKMQKDTKREIRTVAVGLALILAIAGADYIHRHNKTGSWNLQEQSKILDQRRMQKKEEIRVQKQMRGNLYSEIFSQGGFADSDSTGLEYTEIADAYSRAGYRIIPQGRIPSLTGIENITFPKLDLNDLQRIADSYKSEIDSSQ